MAAGDFASTDAISETERLGQQLHPAVTPFAHEATSFSQQARNLLGHKQKEGFGTKAYHCEGSSFNLLEDILPDGCNWNSISHSPCSFQRAAN